MRLSIPAAAAAFVIAAGLGVAACSWPAGRASARESRPSEKAGHHTPPPPLRRLAAVNRVEAAQFDRQLARLAPGNLVLDLRALESLEAAEELTANWRINHPPGADLVCWLRPEGDAAALASAVNGLSAAGCSVLNVALDGALLASGNPPERAALRTPER